MIEKNEFVYIADNVLAGWGETKEWDGRNGDQPRGTVVRDNYIHELGFFEKQSSAWFQALTATTTIENNIMFNMRTSQPRPSPVSLCLTQAAAGQQPARRSTSTMGSAEATSSREI